MTPPPAPALGLARGRAGPFELSAGGGQENVIEGGLVELERGDAQAGLVEGAHELGQLPFSLGKRHGKGPGLVADGGGEAFEGS
jgi:hypothetical protein